MVILNKKCTWAGYTMCRNTNRWTTRVTVATHDREVRAEGDPGSEMKLEHLVKQDGVHLTLDREMERTGRGL